MQPYPALRLSALALALSGALAACSSGGSDDDAVVAPPPEETRVQDERSFTPAEATATTFAAMAAATGDTVDVTDTDRWAGVLDGAAYRIEVPRNWNGKLVMYAHGYRGTGPALTVSNPSIRRYLIQNGYAWAASSYSKNYYDVRAGVEDTNALALAFTRIATANSRPLPEPSRIYITGHSMGGHVTGAAIDAEAQATARNKVQYHGAVPMCGVMGDTELFNQFAAMQVTAQAIAGVPSYPFQKWSEISTLVTGALFSQFPASPITPTALGQKYLSVVENITGGVRPLFGLGVAYGGSFPSAWGTFGGDGTINGILNRSVLDTTAYTYTITGDPDGSAALNAITLKISPEPDANRLRTDGLRWVPKVNGDFRIPVVSIHTLGDLFVPFSMQQVFRERTEAKGNGAWLVQRAIRGASHCDFTVAEQEAAFDDMIRWERDGVRPDGDDVLTAATVAQPTYGCTFTDDTLGPDDSATTRALRKLISDAGQACVR